MTSWILFGMYSVLAYICISIFGHLGGGSGTSPMSAGLSTFKPIPFATLIMGNILWSIAVYYGFQNTRSAIPIAIALGVLTGFVYSIVYTANSITSLKVFGVLLVLVGVYFIR